MWNLLLNASTSLPEGYQKIGVGEAAIDALLGFVVVFIGIAFLVGIIWLVGFVMRKVNGVTAKEKKEVRNKETLPAKPEMSDISDDGLDEETVAVITAAIMAYYAKEKPKCEFTVKRIKRI